MRRSFAFVLVVLAFGRTGTALAQEGTVSVAATAGVALLAFTSVDDDGVRDIAAYQSLGIPIGPYPKLRYAPTVEGAVTYRYDRDLAVAVFASFQQARTTVAVHDSVHQLSLDRRLSGVQAGIDLLYVFPPIVGGGEVSAFIGISNLWASADQTTHETQTFKLGTGTEQRLMQDAYAEYHKSKLIARAGAKAVIPFNARVALTAAVQYQYAPMGRLTGTLREMSLARPHETTIEFNYSALQVMLGAQLTL